MKMKKFCKIIVLSALLCGVSATIFTPIVLEIQVAAASAQSIISGELSNGFSWSLDTTSKVLTVEGTGTLKVDSNCEWIQYQDQIDKLVFGNRITDIVCDGVNVDIDTLVLGDSFKEYSAQGITPNIGFEVSSKNPYFSVYDGALYTNDYKELLRVPTKQTNLEYPTQLRIIGSYAYQGTEAKIIVIPWGVTTIRKYGLTYRSGITVIPNTVTKFDVSTGFRYPSGYYLWEGENSIIATAAEVYTNNSSVRDISETLPEFWDTFGYSRISDICKGIEESFITGWYTMGGYSFYFGKDGKPMTGWQNIDGKWYSFLECGIMRTGMWTINESYTDKLESGQTYCFDENGVLMTNTIYTDPYYGRKYPIDGMGIVNTETSDTSESLNGFITDNGNTYYYEDGQYKIGHQVIDGKVYYFEDNGVMQHSKWIQIYGIWHYLNDNGASVVSCWRLKDGKYVYLNASGGMVTNKWVQDYGNWYYATSDGSRYESTWAKIGGAWYWFGGSGKMAANTWLKLADGNWYYFHSSGAMAANQWVKSGGKWYYLSGSGAMVTNKWVKSGSYWYYLGKDGAMLTNTTTPDGYKVDAQGRWI